MRGGFLAAALVAAMLAGCADDGKPQADALDEAAAAAEALDVEATSTTGVIRGVVVDTSITPVGGVTVAIPMLNQSVVTTELGVFGFEGLEPGTYFLQASHPDYTGVQQSVEVVAGVQEPEAVRIQISYIPRGEPSIEVYQALMFVSGSGWVDGVGGVTVGGAGLPGTDGGNWNFGVDINPNGTVAQTELVWDMTSPLGENGYSGGGTYAGDDSVSTGDWTGPSPLVMRVNATEGDDTADNIYHFFYAWPSAGTPIGFHANQKVEAFIHVFYNFQPNEGWTFANDGPHPLPQK